MLGNDPYKHQINKWEDTIDTLFTRTLMMILPFSLNTLFEIVVAVPVQNTFRLKIY
jgi:hypothetical protein